MSQETPNPNEERRPLPIDYLSPRPAVREPGALTFRRFAAGIGVGVGVSACVYLPMVQGELGIPVIIVLSLKIMACIVLLFVRGWRSFGLGLLTSIPAVVLIFLGVCALIAR